MEKYDFQLKIVRKRVNITFHFQPFFNVLLLGLDIGQKNESLSRKLFALLPNKLFEQRGITSDFTLCEMSTC